MSQLQGHFDDFGMDTVTLPGPLVGKLAAMRGAGFSQVTLAASDLVGHPQGWRAAVQEVRDSGLQPVALHLLRDYEGLGGHLHELKIDIAKSMLELCAALDCRVLVVGASTSTHATTDTASVARDLHKLAMLAVPLNVRIAYQALPAGRAAADFVAAWDLVCRADAPNLGLALSLDGVRPGDDARVLDDLELLDPELVFLVRLADFMWNEVDAADPSPQPGGRIRVFPGEGVQGDTLAELVLRLAALGYHGSYSFDVSNDDYRQIPLETVARRARRAAVWLGEDVLHRAVPMLNLMRLKVRAAV